MILIGATTPIVHRKATYPGATCYFTSDFMSGYYSFTINVVIRYTVLISARPNDFLDYVGIYARRSGLPAVFYFLPLSRPLRLFVKVLATNIFRTVNDGSRRNLLEPVFFSYVLVSVSSVISYATCDVRRDNAASSVMFTPNRQLSLLGIRPIVSCFTMIIRRRDKCGYFTKFVLLLLSRNVRTTGNIVFRPYRESTTIRSRCSFYRVLLRGGASCGIIYFDLRPRCEEFSVSFNRLKKSFC